MTTLKLGEWLTWEDYLTSHVDQIIGKILEEMKSAGGVYEAHIKEISSGDIFPENWKSKSVSWKMNIVHYLIGFIGENTPGYFLGTNPTNYSGGWGLWVNE